METYVNPIAFRLGPFSIHWYAICIVTGIICATWMAVRQAKRIGMSEDDIYDFVLWGVPLSFIGARLYYVIFEWTYYAQHPSQIFAIWNGGIAIYGGLMAGALFLVFFCRKRQLSFLRYLDIVAPGVLLAQGIGRWGNFFNHEAFGNIVSKATLEQQHIPNFIIYNMNIDGIYRQPTFFYESVWDVLGVVVLLLYRRFHKELHDGEIAALYLIWYALGRFFIEGLRADSLYWGAFRVSQVLSVILFIGGWVLWFTVRRKKTNLYQQKWS